ERVEERVVAAEVVAHTQLLRLRAVHRDELRLDGNLRRAHVQLTDVVGDLGHPRGYLADDERIGAAVGNHLAARYAVRVGSAATAGGTARTLVGEAGAVT